MACEDEIKRCMSYFDILPEDKKRKIVESLKLDLFIRFVPEEPAQILAYLKAKKLWDATV